MSQVGCAAREKIASASRYQSNPAFLDEMITSEGQICAHWQPDGMDRSLLITASVGQGGTFDHQQSK